MAKISVHLQPTKYPEGKDVVVELPLSDDMIYEALEPLDIPDPNAPRWAQMLCSPLMKVSQVTMKRERMAKILSDALTHALLDAMGSNDTVMGYKKNVESRT